MRVGGGVKEREKETKGMLLLRTTMTHGGVFERCCSHTHACTHTPSLSLWAEMGEGWFIIVEVKPTPGVESNTHQLSIREW